MKSINCPGAYYFAETTLSRSSLEFLKKISRFALTRMRLRMYAKNTKEKLPEMIFAVIPAMYPVMIRTINDGFIPFAVREQ